MERIETEKLTLEEINKRFGLPKDNDFYEYLDKHENGVLLMDRNRNYTAYFYDSPITFIILIDSDTFSKYISKRKGSKIDSSQTLQLVNNRFISKEKLEKAKELFNCDKAIISYGIHPLNKVLYFINDEENEMMEEWNKQPKHDYYKNPYEDLPYLGLSEDEFETGHWNVD